MNENYEEKKKANKLLYEFYGKKMITLLTIAQPNLVKLHPLSAV